MDCVVIRVGAEAVDRLIALARAPDAAKPDDVRAAVARAIGWLGGDSARTAELADTLTPLLPKFADVIAAEISPALVVAFADAGKPAVAVAVIHHWMATARYEPIGELGPWIAKRPPEPAPLDARVLLAIARAMAFVDTGGAQRLLGQVRQAADAPASTAIDEANLLILAVDDIPPGEGAARRALARVAAERDWHPDSWGRDHGALVALVRKRATSASDRFGGPMMTYLIEVAPKEVKRFAKHAKGGGAAAWVSRMPRTPTAAPGTFRDPDDKNFDQSVRLKAFAQEMADRQQAARLRPALPRKTSGSPPDPGHASEGTSSSRPPAPPPGLGARIAANWFPLVVAIVALILAISLLFR